MRAKKILKVTSISLALVVLVGLCLVSFFLFNPFEGDLVSMRGVVPRNVDFFLHKSDLASDFRSSERFPYPPALTEEASSKEWDEVKRGDWYQKLAIEQKLKPLRDAVTELKKQTSYFDIVDDLIGTELQVAGRFGARGIEDSRWCAYSRVSWKGKAAYGLLDRTFVREDMRKSGVVVTNDGEFYKIVTQRPVQEFFVARVADCVMVSNDRPMIADSYELALGNTTDQEPLEQSGHHQDGVVDPLRRWVKLTSVKNPNVLEYHFQPEKLRRTMPKLRGWPGEIQDDARNEKILASFLNPESWRFLSGSMIFENGSISLLSHLSVNGNKLTPFQKDLFKTENTPRKKWMDAFFRMIPKEACGAAALKMPAGQFVREMFDNVFDRDTRSEVDNAVRATGKYKSIDDVINKLTPSLRDRVGVIMRPNHQSAQFKKHFSSNFPSPFPQWVMVFWVTKGRISNQPKNKPLNDFIHHINKNRSALMINSGYKLALEGKDSAFEFAIPQIPGTGSIAICCYGEYFMFGNSGPFIFDVVQSLRGKHDSRGSGPAFSEFKTEMPPALNGVAFVWADQLGVVLDDFIKFSDSAGGIVDAHWATTRLAGLEDQEFKQGGWKVKYGRKSKIPQSEMGRFNAAVDKRMDRAWSRHQAEQVTAKAGTIKQAKALISTMNAAYLQMRLDSDYLKIWGRVLSSRYVFEGQ